MILGVVVTKGILFAIRNIDPSGICHVRGRTPKYDTVSVQASSTVTEEPTAVLLSRATKAGVCRSNCYRFLKSIPKQKLHEVPDCTSGVGKPQAPNPQTANYKPCLQFWRFRLYSIICIYSFKNTYTF